jgi:hypothetical protein
MDQEKINQFIDTQKTVFDYIKHITALSTGSVVLLATFVEKLFSKPVWKVLILASFSGFILSMIFLTLCGFAVVRSMRTPENISSELVTFTSWSFILGLASFLVAICSLAVFTMRNFL